MSSMSLASIYPAKPSFRTQAHGKLLATNTVTLKPNIQFGAFLRPGIKLAIFTTNVGGTHDKGTRQLLEVAKQDNIDIQVFHPQDVVLQADGEKLYFWLNGQRYDKPPFDVVYPRLGARYISEEAFNILKHLEQMGVVIVNPPDQLRVVEDKYKTHMILAQNNIPQPNTMYLPTTLDHLTESQLSRLGHGDVFVKPNALTSGSKNVVRIQDATVADILKYHPTYASTLMGKLKNTLLPETPHNMLVQQSLANGDEIEDYRCMVTNGQIVSGTLKNDIKAGYDDVYIKPSIRELAINALKALGINSATVDIVDTPEGPKVLEVNPSPGLIPAYREADNLLDAIVEFANKAVKKQLQGSLK